MIPKKQLRRRELLTLPSQYWNCISAASLAAAIGVLLGFILPQFVPQRGLDGLFVTIALGVGLTTGLSGAAAIRPLWLRIASLLLPPGLSVASAIMAYKSSNGMDAVSWAVATFAVPAISMGMLAGIAKNSLRGFVLGLFGGFVGAAAAFGSFLYVDKTGMPISLKFLLYFAAAGTAVQFCIATAVSYAPDPKLPSPEMASEPPST